MDQESIATAFSGVELFRGLSDEQLQSLAGEFSIEPFSAGDMLLNEGQKCTSLCLMLDGEVEAFLPAEGEETQRFSDIRLAILRSGDIFGEYSFVDMRPASASIRGIRDGSLARIEHGALRRMIDADSGFACRIYENLLLVLIDRLRNDDRELDLMAGERL